VHTINPLTGYPSEQTILSASIVAEDCITADAYATAFMAMGIEKACQIAEHIPNIEYYIIYSNDDDKYLIKYSKGMEPLLTNK